MKPGQLRKAVNAVKAQIQVLENQLRTDAELQSYMRSNCPGSLDRLDQIEEAADEFLDNF